MKGPSKKNLIRLSLPCGLSAVLLLVLLCGLSQATEAEPGPPVAAASPGSDRPGGQDDQPGAVICEQTRKLVPNPGFEEDVEPPYGQPDHWDPAGECIFAYDDPGPSSDVAAEISASSVRAEDCRLHNTPINYIPVKPGRFYDFSAQVQADLVQGDAYLRIVFYRWRDGRWENVGVGRTDSVTDTHGAWVKVTGSAQAPAEAEYAMADALLPKSSLGSVWFDDVFLGLATCLDIGKRDDPDPTAPGEMLTYTIFYTNTGREKATNVDVIETYDEYVDFQWADPAPYTGTTVLWKIPELLPGDSGAITVAVQVAEDTGEHALLLNCVQILSSETVKRVYTCISTTVGPNGCAISLYLPDPEKPGDPGYATDYDLTLCNTGSCDGQVYLETSSSLGWDVGFIPSLPIPIAAGACKPVTVSLEVPSAAYPGVVDVTHITATLVCEAPCSRTAVDTGTVTTTVAVPLTGVVIQGPDRCYVNTPCTLGAAVSPPTATSPIDYIWWPPPLAGQGSAAVTYTWSATGTRTIVVTATNAGGTVTDVHSVSVDWPRVHLPLVGRDYCLPGWCPEGLAGKTVFALAGCDDGTLFAGASDGIHRRGAGESDWVRERSTSGEVRGLVASSDCAHVYAAALGDGVLRRDGGSWSVISDSGMGQARTVELAGSVILAGGDFGVRHSPVGGTHQWRSPEAFCSQGKSVVSLVRSDGRIYAAIWGGGVCYCGESNLDQWSSLNAGLDTLFALQAVGSPADGAPRFTGVTDRFYRWGNNRWEEVPAPWGDARTFCFALDGSAVYAGQEGRGVVYSVDGGGTWDRMNTGWVTAPYQVRALLLDAVGGGRRSLYAGTSEGVWRYRLP